MSLVDTVASSPRLRRQIRETIQRSQTEGVEMGFPICLNGNDPEAGEREMTKGDENSTNVVLGCPVTKGEFLGSFHSHLHGPRYPSRKDIANMATSGERVVCTGQKDTVVCLEPKPATGPREIARTVEEINYFTTPWSLAPEFRYMEAVKKNFNIREFSP